MLRKVRKEGKEIEACKLDLTMGVRLCKGEDVDVRHCFLDMCFLYVTAIMDAHACHAELTSRTCTWRAMMSVSLRYIYSQGSLTPLSDRKLGSS
jgi:hypothetical protein